MNQSHCDHEASEKLYQCPECGLHYKEKKYVDQCRAWCKEHHSCNLDITKHAIENDQKN